uniref:Uncharacterized protein n=1 Tax=Candidatus Kentrum sp. FW TaxID=2126338 RepID=A0A450T5Q5_9GAMM|nr:MAG: hypothetical protein BECKFW1821A_GA0114235_11225 [Candidatus Kentron sp. FW]
MVILYQSFDGRDGGETYSERCVLVFIHRGRPARFRVKQFFQTRSRAGNKQNNRIFHEHGRHSHHGYKCYHHPSGNHGWYPRLQRHPRTRCRPSSNIWKVAIALTIFSMDSQQSYVSKPSRYWKKPRRSYLPSRNILLDECMDRKLAREITGHAVTTVQKAGWTSFKNGNLLRAA